MNNPIDIGAMYGINNRSNQMANHNMSTSEIIDEMNMPMQGWQEEKNCNKMTPYNASSMSYQDSKHNMYSNQNHNMNNPQNISTNSGMSSGMNNQNYMNNMHTNNNAQLMPMHNNMGMQSINTAPTITIKNSHLNDKNNIEYMNDLLRTQVGKLAEVEFLIGTNSTHLKQGQITGVGTNYIVIKEFDTGRTTVGNFENIKFVTIYDTDYSW